MVSTTFSIEKKIQKKKLVKIFLKKRDGGGKLWNKLTIFDYMMTMFASGIETSAQSHANKFPESFFLFYFVFLFPSFLPSFLAYEGAKVMGDPIRRTYRADAISQFL